MSEPLDLPAITARVEEALYYPLTSEHLLTRFARTDIPLLVARVEILDECIDVEYQAKLVTLDANRKLVARVEELERYARDTFDELQDMRRLACLRPSVPVEPWEWTYSYPECVRLP